MQIQDLSDHGASKEPKNALPETVKLYGHYRARPIRLKLPEIPVQNRMEQTFPGNSFRKFRFTSRGCPFFWKFGNSENFPFHLYTPPRLAMLYAGCVNLKNLPNLNFNKMMMMMMIWHFYPV